MVEGRFDPTPYERSLVENGAAWGVSQTQIAKRLEIDEKTLRRYFRAELDRGTFVADMAVGKRMYELTQDPDRRVSLEACKWWTARRMGWTEVHDHRHGGNLDAPPIGVAEVTDHDRVVALAAFLAKTKVLAEQEASEQGLKH